MGLVSGDTTKLSLKDLQAKMQETEADAPRSAEELPAPSGQSSAKLALALGAALLLGLLALILISLR
jgi:hypothetical protein